MRRSPANGVRAWILQSAKPLRGRASTQPAVAHANLKFVASALIGASVSKNKNLCG